MRCLGAKWLMVATVATGAPACATTQTMGQQVNDEVVTRRVGSRLGAAADVKRHHIDVDSLNGVVTLRGKVKSEMERRSAETIARSTKGVRDVDNQLEVIRGPTTEEVAADVGPQNLVAGRSAKDSDEWDPWLHSKIWAKLTSDPLVKKRNIDVDVEDGVVTLSGIVESRGERIRAGDLVARTDGVVYVINELRIGSKRR